MRSLISVLFLVLFCSVQLTSSTVIAHDMVQKCCTEVTGVRIPLKHVASYYWTSRICPRSAIVFKTFTGKEICVDPEMTWVSGHVDKVDKRATTAAKTTTTTTVKATTAAAATTITTTVKATTAAAATTITTTVKATTAATTTVTTTSRPVAPVVRFSMSRTKYCVKPELGKRV